jgi:hypothetical protein
MTKQPFHYDGRDKSETRFDNTVQYDPMIHFIANFYRLYCLLVFFFNCKVE